MWTSFQRCFDKHLLDLTATPLCQCQSNKLYHVNPPCALPQRLSVITSLNHSLVIMRCGSKGGHKSSLELLLQLQVCHTGSLSHGQYFMVLIWASCQKVCKWIWAPLLSHWHITTCFDQNQYYLVTIYKHVSVCACCIMWIWLWQRWHPAAEAGNNFCPSVSSTNCRPYRKALIQKKVKAWWEQNTQCIDKPVKMTCEKCCWWPRKQHQRKGIPILYLTYSRTYM